MLCWAGCSAQLGACRGTRRGVKDSGHQSWLAALGTLSLLLLQLQGDEGSCGEVKPLIALKGDVAMPVPPYLNCCLAEVLSV